jgi:hypothetical protein
MQGHGRTVKVAQFLWKLFCRYNATSMASIFAEWPCNELRHIPGSVSKVKKVGMGAWVEERTSALIYHLAESCKRYC